MYQLGKYNTENNLSKQGKSIRDLILQYPSFDTLKAFIEKINVLEEESIVILKKAILAGYWTSYYGFGWGKEQEIQFWELVYKKKPPKSGVAILTLAESYRGNKVKSLSEVIDLYFDAIDINLEHYYSLTQEGGEELQDLLKDTGFRRKCLLIELDIWENLHNYSIEEINEETPHILKRCAGDKDLEDLTSSKIEGLIKRKTSPQNNQ